MAVIGERYLNLSTNEIGTIVGGGPLEDGRPQHWRFQWRQEFKAETNGRVTKEMRDGSITQVRCRGMSEAAGGWAPFEDHAMWRRA